MFKFKGTPQTPPVATVAPEQSQPQQQQAQQQQHIQPIQQTPFSIQPQSISVTLPFLRTPTSEWGIEDVISFISHTDSSLSIHAELFRRHVSAIFFYIK